MCTGTVTSSHLGSEFTSRVPSPATTSNACAAEGRAPSHSLKLEFGVYFMTHLPACRFKLLFRALQAR